MTALTLAAAWRALFLFASAPVIGAALFALIGRVTGARWPAAEASIRWLPIGAAGAALLGVAQIAAPAPPHLSLWLDPVVVGLRGALVVAALWGAMRLVARTDSTTPAAVTLAIYAALVTPIASDWLLGDVPGHPVSAAGMMLVCQQVAGAAAWPLALGQGSERERQDLSRLMVAAALGLGYLLFMDYLIVWFGNLPERVGFYVERSDGLAPLPLVVALGLGWGAAIALLSLGGEWGRRGAGASVLVALLLIDLWWVAAGVVATALVIGGVLVAGLAARTMMGRLREAAHG